MFADRMTELITRCLDMEKEVRVRTPMARLCQAGHAASECGLSSYAVPTFPCRRRPSSPPATSPWTTAGPPPWSSLRRASFLYTSRHSSSRPPAPVLLTRTSRSQPQRQADTSKNSALLEVASILNGLNFNVEEADLCNDCEGPIGVGPATWKFKITRKGKKLDAQQARGGGLKQRAACARIGRVDGGHRSCSHPQLIGQVCLSCAVCSPQADSLCFAIFMATGKNTTLMEMPI